MTQVFTAAVHPIGEDNESTFVLVARSQEALDAKLVAKWNEEQQQLVDNEQPDRWRYVPEFVSSVDELRATNDWFWVYEEHTLDE